MKNFALIGAAGYIAPRHMQAIKDNQGQLIAAVDRFDSVGVLDRYFPGTRFFMELERFDRFLNKQQQKGPEHRIDYLSICTPNHLHDAHIRFGLKNETHAICEKPLVLNPWNIDSLEKLEQSTGFKVFNILQLRLHPELDRLKKLVAAANKDKLFEIDLTYITSRGPWYHQSWKGQEQKSGGITNNIGIHLFDMLIEVFGEVKHCYVHLNNQHKAAGHIELKRANVRWFLSTDELDLPQDLPSQNQRTLRSLSIDNQNFDFSSGFDDLHSLSYRMILNGKGFGISQARASIGLCHQIRNQKVDPRGGEQHPYLYRKQNYIDENLKINYAPNENT